jgi:hypothetical protein
LLRGYDSYIVLLREPDSVGRVHADDDLDVRSVAIELPIIVSGQKWRHHRGGLYTIVDVGFSNLFGVIVLIRYVGTQIGAGTVYAVELKEFNATFDHYAELGDADAPLYKIAPHKAAKGLVAISYPTQLPTSVTPDEARATARAFVDIADLVDAETSSYRGGKA